MEIKYSPEFKFKGPRDYVHGTDIFSNIMTLLDQQKIKFDIFKMSISRLSKTQLDILFTENPKSIKSNTNVFFEILRKARKTIYGYLNENNLPVLDRYDYPEYLISEASKLDIERNSISLSGLSEFSLIEKIVALNKHLLEQLFPDVKGKWYFTKLEINDQVKINPEIIEIRLVKNMAFKLTQSSIVLDNDFVGYIYFTLVLPVSK